MRYRDRVHAGSRLAAAVNAELPSIVASGGVVLGVPRGGVVVAAVVSESLGWPLDIVLARKLGAPGNPELALGAVASGGVRWVNRPMMRRFGLDDAWLEATAAREEREIERRAAAYRGDRPPPDLTDRAVIVVDDGVATGATLGAVLETVRTQQPAVLVCAVPVAPPDSVPLLARSCDYVVCPMQPGRFDAVGSWYDDFTQTTDGEVVALLAGNGGPDDGRR